MYRLEWVFHAVLVAAFLIMSLNLTQSLAASDQRTHCRLYTQPPGGSWIDWSSLDGQDWLIGIPRYDFTIENSVGSLTAHLYKRIGSRVLSPTTSQDVLSEGFRIRLMTANTMPGGTPASWLNVFEGFIDTIDYGGDEAVTVEALDLGSRLQEHFPEQEVLKVGEQEIVPTIQQILAMSGASVYAGSLVVESAPDFFINEYLLKDTNVLQAITDVAKLPGWELRYRRNTGNSAWFLTLFDPENDSRSTYTLSEDHYTVISKLEKNQAWVRNIIKIIWDQVAYESSSYVQGYVTTRDQESITQYGPRMLTIKEEVPGSINTWHEAQALADTLLRHLKQPLARITVEVPYLPHADICDNVTFAGGSRHVLSSLQMIAQSVSHTIREGNRITTIEARERLPERTPKILVDADVQLVPMGLCTGANVTINWEPVTGATDYVVRYMWINEGVQLEHSIFTGGATSANFGPFPLGSQVTFGVAAIVNGERGDYTFITVDFEADPELMPQNVTLVGTNGGFTGAFDVPTHPLYQSTAVSVYDPETGTGTLVFNGVGDVDPEDANRRTFEVTGLTNGVTYDILINHVFSDPTISGWPVCLQVTPYEFVPEEKYEPEFRGFYPSGEPSDATRVAGQKIVRDAFLARIAYYPTGGTISLIVNGDPFTLPGWVFAGGEIRFPRASGAGPIGWTVESLVDAPDKPSPENEY